ncbi:Rmf/CrpP family protein [Methylobacterium sp. NEAU 140]|uniref:ribosome modulation factor n=1 Tax=Methylobacterium sp. NEAU 140 TaxID=3064945 RepID=UPI0027371262|nr:Rmf/CrpP family protein [Methylobacterium sp. NEAU 140]MDP4024245.1 Rmf/CrpP family protein [Methylobacterium sp. NEAU 140]
MSETRDEPRADRTSTDPIAEGARARAQGRPKDACPYPADSPERAAWLEAYDGTPAGRAPDLPMEGG